MKNKHGGKGRARGLSRRDLFKLGFSGACGLGLAGLTGCARQPAGRETDPGKAVPQTALKGQEGSKPSPWFRELNEGLLRCELCPHSCILAPGERAPCRVRENRNGRGYTLVYGNPALVQEDPVERKPFFHVLPGSRALSVSTAGCNLHCGFCEVWEMALVGPEEVHAYEMPPERVVEMAAGGKVRSISYAFGEPVVFFEYMAAVAEQAKKAGLLNLVHTAGYIQPEPLHELAMLADAVNVDLKGFDEDFYREHVGGELEHVLAGLKLLRGSGVHIEITSIVIPTLNDNMEKVEEMCRWIVNELGADVPLHFARFYPLYRLSGLPRTPVSTLEAARNRALKAGLEHVYIAKVTGHEGENTYCPSCGEKVVKRLGFVVEELRLTNGACRSCGRVLPGLWESA